MAKGSHLQRFQSLTVCVAPSSVGQSAYRSTGKISVGRATVLKHIMRSMHRMMQSSGTSEGLRGLLDSSLLQSVKKVMANRVVFGANVLAIGMLDPLQ